MDEPALARVLEECLQAMEAGETDLDWLASRYPEAEKEIRPLLEVARGLRGLRKRGRPLSLRFVMELREQLHAQPVARARR